MADEMGKDGYERCDYLNFDLDVFEEDWEEMWRKANPDYPNVRSLLIYLYHEQGQLDEDLAEGEITPEEWERLSKLLSARFPTTHPNVKE